MFIFVAACMCAHRIHGRLKDLQHTTITWNHETWLYGHYDMPWQHVTEHGQTMEMLDREFTLHMVTDFTPHKVSHMKCDSENIVDEGHVKHVEQNEVRLNNLIWTLNWCMLKHPWQAGCTINGCVACIWKQQRSERPAGQVILYIAAQCTWWLDALGL